MGLRNDTTDQNPQRYIITQINSIMEFIMKTAAYILSALAVIITNIGCAAVAYNYRDLLCAIEHGGFSAPASIAFLGAIPYAIAVAICTILAIVFFKKSKKK